MEAHVAHTHETRWPTYALAAKHYQGNCQLAIGSYIESSNNSVQVVDGVDERGSANGVVGEISYIYPPTKLMFGPSAGRNIFACTTTVLDVVSISQARGLTSHTLKSRKSKDDCAPLTSFDWIDNKIVTSCTDTTCTIWDLEAMKRQARLIAHDRAVFDVSFLHPARFASVGEDGSMRIFDTRNLERSTIVHENRSPLLRLAWNRQREFQIAALSADLVNIVLVDVRRPLWMLMGFQRSPDTVTNHIAWAPSSSNHLLCGNNDGFSVLEMDSNSRQPEQLHRLPTSLRHDTDSEVQQVHWFEDNEGIPRIAIGMAKKVEICEVTFHF